MEPASSIGASSGNQRGGAGTNIFMAGANISMAGAKILMACANILMAGANISTSCFLANYFSPGEKALLPGE